MSSASNSPRKRSGIAGVTSLELALVLPVFMILMMAVFDFGRYFYTVQAMTALMTDTARYVMVRNNGQSFGPSSISSWVGSTGSPQGVITPFLLDPNQGEITVSFLNQEALPALGVNQVQVTVTTQFTTLTPGLSGLDRTGANPLTMTATYSY